MILKPLLYILFICVLPLSILWTQQLNQGIQVAVTIACVSSVSVVVVVGFWKSADLRIWSGMPGQLQAEYQSFEREKHSALFSLILWLGAMCVFLVPISILWSGGNDPGVKAALMAGLAPVLLVAAISYGIWWLYQAFRGELGDPESDSESGASASNDDSPVHREGVTPHAVSMSVLRIIL